MQIFDEGIWQDFDEESINKFISMDLIYWDEDMNCHRINCIDGWFPSILADGFGPCSVVEAFEHLRELEINNGNA